MTLFNLNYFCRGLIPKYNHIEAGFRYLNGVGNVQQLTAGYQFLF